MCARACVRVCSRDFAPWQRGSKEALVRWGAPVSGEVVCWRSAAVLKEAGEVAGMRCPSQAHTSRRHGVSHA